MVTNKLTNCVEQNTLQKLAIPHLDNKFPTFYGSLRFIGVFTKARY